MSNLSKPPGQKKYKLSRTKTLAKKDVTKQVKVPVKSLFEVSDLNETSDFKEPMSFKKDSDNADRFKQVYGNLGNQLERNDNETPKDANQMSAMDTDETVLCQVCSKNISHMNTIRREQHVNRCIDKMEENEKEEKQQPVQLAVRSKPSVLDCPMCKKAFKSFNTRQTHLKKCASINNITTEALLKLVKSQEQESENLQPPCGITQPSKTAKQVKAGPSRKRKIKEPKSQFDEDVQLALAVSSSLANENKSAEEILEENLTGVTGQNKRRKKKNVLEDVCLLTTLSDEDRRRRIEQKLHSVLLEEDSEGSDPGNTPPLHDSSLRTKHSESQKKLWPLANHFGDNDDIISYYVPALMPPITVNQLQTGSRLKRLSTIPGRETSFVSDTLDNTVKNTSQFDEVFVTASTQTAVVLAELAADDDAENNDTIHLSPTTDVSLKASGFCEENLIMKDGSLNQSRLQTLMTFRQMVNQSDYSDLSIKTSDGMILHAHKVIIFNRFPELVKLLETSSSSLSLPLSKESALSFLTYMYTGELHCTVSIQHELKQMANSIHLPSLKDVCSELITANKLNHDKLPSEDKSEVENMELHPVMNLKDIWGESDSEGDDPALDKKIDGTDTECELDKREPICDEDYNEIMLTQKRRNSSGDKSVSVCTDSDADMCIISHIEKDPISERLIKKNSVKAIHDTDSENDHQTFNSSPSAQNSDEELTNKSAANQNYSHDNCDHDVDIQLSQPLNRDERHQESGQNSTSPTVILVDKDPAMNDEMNLSQTLNNSDVPAMDTSNVDLFQSLSPPASGLVSNVEINSPNKSTLFKNRLRTQAVQKCNFTVSDIIDVDSESEDEKEEMNTSESLKTTPSKCFTQDQSHNSDISDFDHANIDTCDAATESRLCDTEIDNKATEDISSSPSISKHDESKLSDDDQLQNTDDELQITGDNFDELLTQSEKKKELNYLGTPIATYKSKSLPDTKDEVIINDKNDSNIKHVNSPCKGADPITIVTNNDGPSAQSPSGLNVNISNSTTHTDNVKDNEPEDEIDLISWNGSSSCHGDTYNKDVGDSGSQLDVSQNSFGSDGADVWEGFDDCGMAYNHVPSPVTDQQSDNHTSHVVDRDEDVTLIEDEDEFVPNDPSDLDLPDPADPADLSLLNDNDDSFVFNVNQKKANEKKEVNQFKTPTTSNKTRQQKKEWVPPSPFTPMPEYDKMNTPTLKNEVKKYGVKPVGKKRMVTVLKDIYQQTHQYETDSEFEDDSKTDDVDKLADINSSPNTDDDNVLSQNVLPLSQESDTSDLMEESILMGESTSDSDTQSSPQKGVDIKKKLHNFITSNQDLQLRVLMYEPLEVDVLKADLKEAGIKCSMDKLLEFLDEKCIAFTSKNARKRKPSKRGKKKDASKP